MKGRTWAAFNGSKPVTARLVRMPGTPTVCWCVRVQKHMPVLRLQEPPSAWRRPLIGTSATTSSQYMPFCDD